MAAPADTSIRGEIRKLRKKLRQIERLEHLDRDITDDEYLKIEKKDEIRELLLELLTQDSDYSGISSSSVGTEFSYPTSNYVPTTELIHEEPDEEHSSDHNNYVTPDYNQSQNADNAVDYGSTEEQLTIRSDQPHDSVNEEQPMRSDGDKVIVPETEENKTEHSGSLDDTSSVPDPPKKARKDEKKKAKNESSVPVRPREDPWRGVPYRVRTLEGHNDIVLCTATHEEILVTGSRDTMVKVWNMDSGLELRSYGSHTGTITCLCILNQQQSSHYGEDLELEENERLILSGSTDCSIKVWGLKAGHLLKSIYTYNPVSCLSYLTNLHAMVSTSSGGKLELWDIKSGQIVESVMAHTDAVTCMTVYRETTIILGTCDGLIKIYQRKPDGLRLLFVSENVQCSQGLNLHLSSVRCVSVVDDSTILYGDEGVNIKVLNWRTGTVRKVRNHGSEFGITDDIREVSDDVLVASGYDLDSGYGYLNVFSKPGLRYLCTLTDDETGRILSTSTSTATSRWVTSGLELKLWDRVTSRSAETIQTQYLPIMSNPALDTDVESDDDDVTINHDVIRGVLTNHSPDQQDGWTSWCAVL